MNNSKNLRNKPVRMTIGELALTLNIHESTVKKLVRTKQLPHIRDRNKILFDFGEILDLFKTFEGGAA